MFHTRITEAWGAPAGVRDNFLLERMVELPSGVKLLCGRERTSGIRRWLKFAATPEHEAAIALESAALTACAHPHLAALIQASEPGSAPWFALEWQGEAPLDEEAWQRLPAIDRLRLAPALVSVVEALASSQVAVPDLSLEHLWVSPALHWLRVVGLPGAVPQAGPDSIRETRRAAAALLERMITAPEAGQAEASLAGLVSNWSEDGDQALAALAGELDRALLVAVTADL
jgi:hypothetical protein